MKTNLRADFALLFDEDRETRWYAADRIEKATRAHPELLSPYRDLLLNRLTAIEDKGVRWHVAQMLPRVACTHEERERVIEILHSYLAPKEGSIVRTSAMQSLVDIGATDALPVIERLTRTGTPAMRARGRKLLRREATTDKHR